MTLYRKLFGNVLMRPEDGGEGSSGGGAVDRGDNFAPADDVKTAAPTDDKQVDEDLKVATGEDKQDGEEGSDEQPRDAQGKFTKKERDTDATIPKARFDEAVRKEREAREAAERRLQEIEQQRQQIARGADIQQLESNVKELRAAERKALIAGDDDKAAELGAQADALNRQIAIEQARDMSAAAKEQAREEIRWDMTIERIEAEYPALDEASDEFDQDLTDEVVDRMNGLMSRERLPRSQALLKAVKLVMARRTETAAAASQDDKPKGLDRGAAPGRKEAAVAKNIDAANRQPASPKKVGADSDKFGQTKNIPDADDMTFEEFSALPEATKAQMRGDFV